MKSSKAGSQFGANLLRLQDEERRRIARELHSTTAQRLAALQLNLALVARSADTLDARARAALADSIDLVRTCSQEIGSVSYRLHPPLLDEFGLVAALRAFAEEYTQRTGIGMQVELPETLERLPRDIEIGVFRIVQDGVASIAPSTPATLRLERNAAGVVLDLICPSANRDRDPLAIAAIHERARQMNGRLVIKTSPASVALRVKIPLRRGVKAASI